MKTRSIAAAADLKRFKKVLSHGENLYDRPIRFKGGTRQVFWDFMEACRQYLHDAAPIA